MQRNAIKTCLEPRLHRRYLTLLRAHMRDAPKLAPGVASLPAPTSSFAATQAAWRFLNNERVTLATLAEPIRSAGVQGCARTKSPFCILVHDWCKITYERTKDKVDLTQLTHQTDIGHELTTALLVNADNGAPIAPMEMHLKTATGVLSTRDPAPEDVTHLEQVLPTMEASKTWGLDKPCLHVIDREADSVDHYRTWNAAGHLFLVRADDRRVRWDNSSYLLSELAERFRSRNQLKCVGDAHFHGKPAKLWVGETRVILDRPAKKNVGGVKSQKPGEPIELRFIVAEVRDDLGVRLGDWMLLSNTAEETATTEHLARCYYWRWRIESFFKWLKSHGHQMEYWGQQTGISIARRLLIAAMACVLVWGLMEDDSVESTEFKNVLIRLSGRQMKRSKPYTAPALLAGVQILLSTLATLEQIPLSRLKQMADLLPSFDFG